MSITDLDEALTTAIRQDAFADGVDYENERITKLLEADCERPLDPNWEHYRESCSCAQLALIKGESND